MMSVSFLPGPETPLSEWEGPWRLGKIVSLDFRIWSMDTASVNHGRLSRMNVSAFVLLL